MNNTSPHADTAATVCQSIKVATPSTRQITSSELLQGDTEIFISHPCGVYRLRVTAAGKLILTK